MKVWIVLNDMYEIMGVYKTYESADKAIDKFEEEHDDAVYDIEEYEVNE